MVSTSMDDTTRPASLLTMRRRSSGGVLRANCGYPMKPINDLGFIAERLKVPALVGYLLAGIIIGPATPGFVADIADGGAIVRNRRDVADVRRRAAFLTQ
jgi:hypothetical protein